MLLFSLRIFFLSALLFTTGSLSLLADSCIICSSGSVTITSSSHITTSSHITIGMPCDKLLLINNAKEHEIYYILSPNNYKTFDTEFQSTSVNGNVYYLTKNNCKNNQPIKIYTLHVIGKSFERCEKNINDIVNSENDLYFEYNEKNLISRISDKQGSEIFLSYDETNNIDNIIDHRGIVLYENSLKYLLNPNSSDKKTEENQTDRVSLIFRNPSSRVQHEISYYKNSLNTWDFDYHGNCTTLWPIY